MQTAVLVVALACGLATVAFIVSGLWRAVRRGQALGVRSLLLTTIVSLLTGAFTLWQLALVAQQLHISW